MGAKRYKRIIFVISLFRCAQLIFECGMHIRFLVVHLQCFADGAW
jgi:hypothetical protein